MENKERIIEESRKLFMKFGVRRVTMDDVARNLSMSKKTLYRYFSDKDELVEQSTRAHIDIEHQELMDAARNSSNAIEELFLVSKCIRENINEINPSVLFDLKRFYPTSFAHWTRFRDDFIALSIISNLKRGVEDGYFRADINLEIMAKLRLMEIQLLFDDEIFPNSQVDFKEVQIQLFDHFVFGIVTEKGRDLYLNYVESDKKETYA